MINKSAEDWFKQAVLIEESAFIAFMDPDNPYYAKARSFFLEMDDLERCTVTSSYVINNTHQWLRDHHGYAHAEFFLDSIERTVDKGRLKMIHVNQEWEAEALRLLHQYPQFQLSIGEALNAAIAAACGIGRIFTFNPVYWTLLSVNPELKVIPSI